MEALKRTYLVSDRRSPIIHVGRESALAARELFRIISWCTDIGHTLLCWIVSLAAERVLAALGAVFDQFLKLVKDTA